jgi:hypothetical protein
MACGDSCIECGGDVGILCEGGPGTTLRISLEGCCASGNGVGESAWNRARRYGGERECSRKQPSVTHPKV